MRRSLSILASAFALAVVVLAAGVAQARPGEQVTFEAPASLKDPATREVTLDKLESLGVREIRLLVSWSAVAPSPSSAVRPAGDLTNPSAYGWGPYPAIVAAARAHGISTEVTIAGPAPRWGTQGARDQITNPRPSDYQHFVTAIARRFKGQVALWTVWNEPNFRTFLMPQLVNGKPASPATYRGLFLAAVAGMKAAGQPGAKLLIGETAPRSGAGGVAPLAFLRGLLCLDGSYHPIKARHCAPLRAYGWAHHPYAPAAGPFFTPAGRDDVTIGSLSRLTSALSKAVKAHALTTSRLFLTEFGVQSYPDKLAGVPLDKQSDYRFGKRKPAYDSFRLPLVATPTGRTVSLWGLVRPTRGATSVTVLRADHNSSTFKPLATAKTKPDGSWTLNTTNATGRRWRVSWKAPNGTTYTGPPTKAYKRR